MQAAITYSLDKDADFDLRTWSIGGLGLAYHNAHDKELMKLMINILKDENEQKPFRRSALRSLLNIYGLTEREIVLRSGLYPSQDDFKVELQAIERLMEIDRR